MTSGCVSLQPRDGCCQRFTQIPKCGRREREIPRALVRDSLLILLLFMSHVVKRTMVLKKTSSADSSSFSISRLHNNWKSSTYSPKTLICLYNTLVKPLLPHEADCWRMIKCNMSKIIVCLKKICCIFWPNKIK